MPRHSFFDALLFQPLSYQLHLIAKSISDVLFSLSFNLMRAQKVDGVYAAATVVTVSGK